MTTVALLVATVYAPLAAAQEGTAGPAGSQGHDQHPGDTASAEAGRHFRHGVELYGEADYSGALVEFKRAYALAPSAAALYNVGEAQYQLQDYASALKTFRRFLGEYGPNESHRAEVERDVEVLRTRVAHVSITTVPVGAEVTVDDHPVGKTPIDEPLLVSVGHRKLMASMAGRAPVTWYVDVAAEDDVSVTLQLRPGAGFTPAVGNPERPSANVQGAQLRVGPILRIAGFVGAGVLAAGAVTFGVLAVDEASALKNARSAFPATRTTINHDASLTTTYSILADSLAAAAIVVGGLALFGTVSSAKTDASRRATVPATRVTLGPASARLEMTF